MPPELKDIFDIYVNIEGDFSMGKLAEQAWPLIEVRPTVSRILEQVKTLLGTDYRKLCFSILRNSFLIELVKVPKIETTKFRTRWFNQLDADPRFCSFEECLEIAENLFMSLPSVLQNPAHKEAIALSLTYGVVPYEAPIDCQLRLTSQGRIQQCGNIVWFVDDLVLRTLKLRKFLTDSATSPDPQFFRQVIADKIKVKTYLTDRVLTGEHKTNREKRWETHPNSVHFAERRTCMAIEYILVTQLCAFDGFPQAALDRLNAAKLLPSSLPRALCPITGKALSYEGLRDELLNPTHGKSNYQVGHLNPLKCEPEDGKSSGHTADNIGWISADGNRIQGSLALEDVRLLVKRIAENYARYKW